ncbi:oxidoreductase [Stipitochalara longipes BDJ]|nr:oxidoreductase [Stipitochalara longipes BDJ]
MQAIQVQTKGENAVFVNNRPTPAVPRDCLLVKTVAVGLNPHELLDIYPPWSISDPGDLLGCDYAGIVEEIGSEVTRNFKKGDRVCGCTRPNPLQPDWGAFAEYIIVVADVQVCIPDWMSFEDAASLGVTVLTTGALLDSMDLQFSDNESRRQILIYGGSTSMGRMMLQFAKMSDFEIITTCSPDNFELVKFLGADHSFDYNDSSAPSKIQALTKDSLTLCVDCFSEQSSYDFCSKTLPTGASYRCIGPVQPDRSDIDFQLVMGVLYFNAPFKIQDQILPAPPELCQSAVAFAKTAEHLLKEGKIKPHPKEIREGGLKGVLDGIQDMREKKVRGKKLVYVL